MSQIIVYFAQYFSTNRIDVIFRTCFSLVDKGKFRYSAVLAPFSEQNFKIDAP